MIGVVTLNPALDVTHEVDRTDWAGVNRTSAVHVRPGGKGVNVARTLRALGADVTLAGLAGGGTGRELVDCLCGSGISIALTEVAAPTRRTFTVVDLARGQAAVFNEPGPQVDPGEYGEFFVTYEKTVAACSAVVLSGSLPRGLADDTYAKLIAAAARIGVPAVLDTSGEALRLGAAAGPAVVKPNLAELEFVAGRRMGGAFEPDLAATERAARELASLARACGADAAVVVSLGPRGLLAVTPEGTWRASPADPVTGNPTGAGDAVVAALAHGLVRRQGWPERLWHAAALGAATAAAPVGGEFRQEEYQHQLARVTVSRFAGPEAGQ